MASVAFDWKNYQKLADELLVRPEEECLRSAISRAYYSILNQGKERLLANGHPPSKRTHSMVWDGFSRSKDAACKKIASWGPRLKEKREDADYQTVFPGDLKSEAELAVWLCSALAADLAQIPSHLPSYPP
jgi:uncharacterized protein (UPF0332 family)